MSASADQLMRDLGQSIALGDALVFNEQHCSRLMVDTHLAIDFEHVADEELLQIYSVLGEPPAQGREQFYRELLTANLFGNATQGATLSFDPVFNQVLLTRTVELENATSPSFLKIVEAFVNGVEYWKTYIADFAPDESESSGGVNAANPKAERAPIATSSLAEHMMMRV